MTGDEGPLVDLLADLEREAAREDLPRTLQAKAKIRLGQGRKLLDYFRACDVQAFEEQLAIIDQSRARWESPAILDRLAGIVEVDESQEPVAVTIHWERAPKELRAPAVSLATELVDAYRGRSVGGRPRK